MLCLETSQGTGVTFWQPLLGTIINKGVYHYIIKQNLIGGALNKATQKEYVSDKLVGCLSAEFPCLLSSVRAERAPSDLLMMLLTE